MISKVMAHSTNVEQDSPSTSYKNDHKASTMTLSLHQRRRSHSSSFSVASSVSTYSYRQRTHTAGPSSPSNELQRSTNLTNKGNRRRSPSNSSTSARFLTSTSDFHLPQRLQSPTVSHASVFSSSALVSPKASSNYGSASVEDTPASSYSSLPLLRRKAAAAALAHASRKGLRRGSMLGKEVAKNVLRDTDSDCDEDDMDMESNDKSRSPSSPLEAKPEDVDEEMQIDTGEVTVAGVKLNSSKTSSRSPSPVSKTSMANRRAMQRRLNLLPKDRGVLRVAASLRDETRPAEGEIASEAKLQRRLGPDSDSYIPTTPKLLARRSQSPFGHASSGGILDRSGDVEDFYFVENAHFDRSDDDSDYDGDDDMVTTKTGQSSITLDAEVSGTASEYFDHQGIAIPGTDLEASQKDKLWNSFRNAANPRLSPGVDRSNFRGRGASVVPSGTTAAPAAPLSSSLGSALDHAMEMESFTSVIGSSPSLWGRSAKRKIADDRYEPYSASSIYKRRAVSPIAFAQSNNRGQYGSNGTNTTLSPRDPTLSQVSPLFIQGPYSSTISNLPTPTPLSIPSPTISLSRMPGFSGSSSRSLAMSMANSSRTGMPSASTDPSPSSTRPSTPTNMISTNPFGVIAPSPSLLSSSAGKTVTTPGANGGGSGPGYGSGALGLSLGGGSKRYKQEQQEMEEEEGMLGDVSAIKLGEI